MKTLNIKRIDKTKLMEMICRTVHEAEGPCENQSASCLAHVNLRVCDIAYMIDEAVEDGEKQVEREHVNPAFGNREGVCPSCFHRLRWDYNRNYCGDCGQPLKWSINQRIVTS